MTTSYTAATAAVRMNESRARIDAALTSGALFGVDTAPDSTRRRWRIEEADLMDWHHRGRPTKKADDAA